MAEEQKAALTPSLKQFVDWLVGEAMQSGAGLADCPNDDEIASELYAALGFTHEDIDALNDAAMSLMGGAPDRVEHIRSLASRIAALLPPTP